MDFSGTWQVSLANSTFLQRPPDRIVVEIEHRDPKLTQTVVTTKAGIDERAQFVFTTDGEASTYEFRGASGVTRARWVGEELVIETRVEWGDRGLYFCDHWTLSEDGRVLTMEHRDDDLQGQRTELRKIR